MIVVAGPRIDPASLPSHAGLEVVPYVHNLYRHLAACDLAVVQGGLTTSMELTAQKRPFLYFPLRHHFEQNFHVRHRLERYGAGRRMDFDDSPPERIAAAIARGDRPRGRLPRRRDRRRRQGGPAPRRAALKQIRKRGIRYSAVPRARLLAGDRVKSPLRDIGSGGHLRAYPGREDSGSVPANSCVDLLIGHRRLGWGWSTVTMVGGCRTGCGSGSSRCCRLPPLHPLGSHRRGVPKRDAMDAILLVLRTGMQWNALERDRGLQFLDGAPALSGVGAGGGVPRDLASGPVRLRRAGRDRLVVAGGRRCDEQGAAGRAEDRPESH